MKRTTVLRTANNLGLLLVSLGLIAGGVLLLVIQDIVVLSASYLLGAALVIGLFAVLVWRGIRIALNARDHYAMLVAAGITAVIAFQSLINIGVVTNAIPNTGQPLPFISYGGTSLVFTMGMMGMLLNISRYPKEG